MLLVEKAGIETGILPKDTTGAAQTGQYISMKNFNHCTIIIQQGAWAGGTPAVTLKQAQDVSATGEKAAPIPNKWSKLGTTAGQFAKAAVVSDTFNLPATANTMTVLEIDAEQLDVTNGFDCISLQVATPGSNADLLSVTYILSEPRFNGAIMADAKVD